MTVQAANPPFNNYTAAPGATVFPYSFKVIRATDLKAMVNGATKTLGVDYTISGVGENDGGDVTFLTPMTGGEDVVVRMDMPFDRETDYQQNGDFLSPTVNNDFDRIWLGIQQLSQSIVSAIKLPFTTASDQAINLSAAERANTVLAFDADGNVTVSTTDAANVIAAQAAAAAAEAAAASVDPNNIVHRTGTETIGGQKTFTLRPIVGTASPKANDATAASTAYVDAVAKRVVPNFINSSAMVAQRITAPNLSTTRQIGLCDNIGVWASGGAVSAGTISQVTSAISGSSGYASRAAGVTLTGSGQISHSIRMEARDARKYKNKTVSFSVAVDHDVGSAINYRLVAKKPTAADNFASTTIISTSSNVSVASATAALLTFNNVAIGDVSNGLELEVQAVCGAITTKNFNVSEFYVNTEVAAGAYDAPEYADELARCQRYLPFWDLSYATTNYSFIGQCISTNDARIFLPFKTPPRIPPTGITVGGTVQIAVGNGGVIGTGITFAAANNSGITVAPVAASGLVTGNATMLANAASSFIYGTGCEL